MDSNTSSKIGCPIHGWLGGRHVDSEIRVGSQYRFPIECAYCPSCNKYYTTSLAINLGKATPVNGVTVEKGIVPNDTDTQAVYVGPAVPLKNNNEAEKRTDTDNKKASAKSFAPALPEKVPVRSHTHPEAVNKILKETDIITDEFRKIVYIDLEVSQQRKEAVDYAAVYDSDDSMHSGSISEFLRFVSRSKFICGHNLIAHDLKYVQDYLEIAHYTLEPIDTLLLSPLLRPELSSHKLHKDEKLIAGELNNPLNDAIKAKNLFHEEIDLFRALPSAQQSAYSALLFNAPGFRGFFQYLNCGSSMPALPAICLAFRGRICTHSNLESFIKNDPVELAYVLAACSNGESGMPLSTLVMENYPKAIQIYNQLRGRKCEKGCSYCNKAFDIRRKLKEIFKYSQFRSFDGVPLQEKAVEAAVSDRSLLAVFPTGGGKSLTFQLPAIMAGAAVNGLTVVISPLLSLMKDQVDNLEEKGLIEAVAINSLLSPIERAEALQRIREGRASILYIAPESLRSKTIERVLLERNVVRFVIDEAHCFSAWGQDFRVDYLFIATFIKQLQSRKKDAPPIAVSCFTATAKLRVIRDICDYFRQNLGLELEVFSAESARKNLKYHFLPVENDAAKYMKLRSLLEARNCPSIVYVSRTKEAEEIARRLEQDGISAKPFHGRMDRNRKVENQNAFINNEVRVIVATSAFGMGVDKRDVQLIVHFDISGSLEDYFQESGRAGRDERMTADCFVLYHDDDLNKHFQNLTRSKLNLTDINQIWRAIKQLPTNKGIISQSALEIGRQAGWNEESQNTETRVKAAINALETAGYIERGMNSPVVYATGVQVANMMEARARLDKAGLSERELENAARVANTLITERITAKAQNDKLETRVDYIADILGLPREDTMRSVENLKSCGVIADSKDMTVFLHRGDKGIKGNNSFRIYSRLEAFMIQELINEAELLKPFTYIELNTRAEAAGLERPAEKKLKEIIYFWTIRKYIEKDIDADDNTVRRRRLLSEEEILMDYNKRIELCKGIIQYLTDKARSAASGNGDAIAVTFSLKELTECCAPLTVDPRTEDVEYALLYLSRIHALELDGGFLVLYNALRIRKLVSNRVQYKKDDYAQLDEHYTQRRLQIHIVGEFAKRMISSMADALVFAREYFQMDSESFQRKYFKGERRDEIKRNITPQKYQALFGDLSAEQKRIIDDNSQYIVVAAGPGSGKTKVLVHKLASLLHLEDVKPEQLLMLTFSRAAATEFKERLQRLYGEALPFVEIRTFHSYCYRLLGKYGNNEENKTVVSQAIEMIQSEEVDQSRISKTVLVIDEAQDMNTENYRLIEALIDHNEDMRVIAVGDDDQNIYGFRGSNSKYMETLLSKSGAVRYELLENYRSGEAVINCANSIAATLSHRMKTSLVRPITKNIDSGNVVLTKYMSEDLTVPVVESLLTHYNGKSACVLTRTNDEALMVHSLLQKKCVKVKLIQSNDDIVPMNLAEIRYFIKMLDRMIPEGTYHISEHAWKQAMDQLSKVYARSTCLNACKALLEAYWRTEVDRRKSDLIEFIQESNLDDYRESDSQSETGTITVSTMHKAKGREYDQVFILLCHYKLNTDEEKRLLYVAMTRAKHELYIHYNDNTLDFLEADGVTRKLDRIQYEKPTELILQLSPRDVFLDFFEGKKRQILQLRSGDPLTIRADGLYAGGPQDSFNAVALSKNMRAELGRLRSVGFKLDHAKIRFILAWKSKEKPDGDELAVILPTLYLTQDS